MGNASVELRRSGACFSFVSNVCCRSGMSCRSLLSFHDLVNWRASGIIVGRSITTCFKQTSLLIGELLHSMGMHFVCIAYALIAAAVDVAACIAMHSLHL